LRTVTTTILLMLVILPACSDKTATAPVITVYKSPTCSCCGRWITHLEKNGFKVIAKDVKDVTPYKIKGGLTPKLASCHTGFVNGYTIEGHVPATDIKRLLKEKPAVRGLSVPAMPIGTPGMEMGSRKDPYNVISFDKDGKTKVFSKH